MPKAPINSRNSFFETIRADQNKSKRILDWNQVQTDLGPMAEPRALTIGAFVAPLTNIDVIDASIDGITELTDGEFAAQTGTGGQQLPVDY